MIDVVASIAAQAQLRAQFRDPGVRPDPAPSAPRLAGCRAVLAHLLRWTADRLEPTPAECAPELRPRLEA